MNQIPAVFLHTTTQLLTGLAVGTVVDGVFPEPCNPLKSGDWKAFIVLSTEVTGQLIVNGLVTVALLDAMSNLPLVMQDRTMGTVHWLMMMHSQPKLDVKMGRLGAYTRNLFAHALGIAPDEIQLSKGAPHNRAYLAGSQKQVNNVYA